jgi:hypothetical protein
MFLSSASLVLWQTPAAADLTEWLKSDTEKFYDVRNAFPEHSDLGDLDFAQRMLKRTQDIDDASEPERDKFFTILLHRVPQYREYSKGKLKEKLIGIISKAVKHFIE